MSYDPSRPLVVAFGGGVNSTAMLCGFKERGLKPDLILFADTGGELPDTYWHVNWMAHTCMTWWGVGIERVRHLYEGEFEGLEGECIRRKQLPSLAYGRKACSMKYKVQPQQRRLKQWMRENGWEEVTNCIGYDANEGHRKTDTLSTDLGNGKVAHNWFPLIDWQWRREDCIAAIERHGLPKAPKSACFFCPAMKHHEIVRLRAEYPEHYDRAIAIERAANGPDGANETDRGLTGRALKWEDITRQDAEQGKLWQWLDENDPNPIPCGCFDG